ncbi:MAG: hypothetical protein R3F56_22000 [Planctomycetota bacterium]
MTRLACVALALSCVACRLAAAQAKAAVTLAVDPARGDDKAKGDPRHPLASIAAAIARLPDPVEASTTIELAGGEYASPGGRRPPEHSLVLARRMLPGVVVRLVGVAAADAKAKREADRPTVLAWRGDEMVRVAEGTWELAQIQVGTFDLAQRRGVMASGPCTVHLRDVTFRLRSNSDAAIWASRGALVALRGKIAANEHLHDAAEAETFSGILATDHGIVEFEERDGASLDLGNGSLSVRGYGMIRLGCARARITCWTQSNNLAINSSGRIDVRNTEVTLRAQQRNNTPIGLEHDGHLLAEDAKITIVGPNDSAIALQKASTFTCNDIALDGTFEYSIWASSGSMFVGRFLGDVTKVRASTGAGIHIEKVGGKVVGPVEARSGGVVSLPDRVVRSD